MTTEYVISTQGLGRDFLVGSRLRRTRVTAVTDVTLDVAHGEAVGFLGPNGAGKSTTIKMLTGVLVPSAGTARVCGLDPVRERRALARRIGVVFGQRSQLWWDLPLAESFALHGAIHRVPAARHRERLDECVELMDMAGFLATPVRQLSMGQRMRGEVTAALLHSPELLVLDEPTIGLDLASKERLRTFLSAVNARGEVTLLLTTHDLPDVERLCRRIVVIDRGRVLVDDDLDTLRRRFAGHRSLVVELASPASPPPALPGVVGIAVEAQGLRWRLEFTAATSAATLIAEVAQRAELRDVTVDEPSIEDLVRTLYLAVQPETGPRTPR
ncbi:ATP-binding cassette domain-containing protein [Pseudonocardia sp.]|uniref:ABC transporter ATP-binding protein n=1 Tax=Pseudonocardia sp. TaxID=60912 RepID=UPI0026357DF4|nr:ATP-binding cassette domain-containing protein [Pseudonocardia sp.]